MIHSILIFNKDCLPRLTKFYTPIDIPTQQLLVRQVYHLINQRTANESSFLTPPPLLEDLDDIQIIYKNYATLYFVFIVDDQESELGILDLIQTFVQALDRCFENVCELDLVFGWQTLQSVVEEIVQGGIVIETDLNKIVKAIDDANASAPATFSSTAFAALASSGFTKWGA